MSERPRLDSWKEIARYLGRDIRTVIRWEQSRGLPVYRVPGGKLPRVFAYQDEIDQWLASGADAEPGNGNGTAADRHSAPAGWLSARVVVAIAVIGLAGIVTGWALTRSTAGAPQQLAIVGNVLRALDDGGRTRWEYHFEAATLTPPAHRWTHVADLDGDGGRDVLASLEVGRAPSTQHEGRLLRFSDAGQLQWSVTADDRFRFGHAEYGPPWPAADVVTYRVGGQTRIAWSLHHFTWWPGLLITLDAEGRRLGTFVNSGWIRTATPSRDGRHLFVTGITNSRRSYFVAVLDAAHPTGRSPEPAGGETQCETCPAGDPLQYIVFPRTDVSLAQPFPGNGPTVVTFDDGRVEVHVLESGGPGIAATIYELGSDLRIASGRFSDSFWEWHRTLEEAGAIRHTAEDCPERQGLRAQSWTRTADWQTIPIAMR